MSTWRRRSRGAQRAASHHHNRSLGGGGGGGRGQGEATWGLNGDFFYMKFDIQKGSSVVGFGRREGSSLRVMFIK